jgi:ABC-2 type transport system ATP-binding protein
MIAVCAVPLRKGGDGICLAPPVRCMLEVENLSKSFGNVQAGDRFSFRVDAGEIVALLGPNGAGKTTTLRCICGILKPDAGTIRAGGVSLQADPVNAKRLLAYIPEVPNPYELLTVREHIRFVALAYGTMDRFEDRLRDLLERDELKEKERAPVGSLSKGMKKTHGRLGLHPQRENHLV